MNDFIVADDFRIILKNEFQKRQRKNSSYSLRSFARLIGWSPQRLSDVLRGRYGISRSAAESLSKKLKFASEESEYFCNLVEAESGRSPITRELAKKYLQEGRKNLNAVPISPDAFLCIQDWHHHAILEALDLNKVEKTAVGIANHLGLPVSLVKSALERLHRVGQVTCNLDGTYQASFTETEFASVMPNSAIREFHRQILEKATESIEGQTIEERELGALIFKIEKDQIPEMKKFLQEMRREFDRRFGKSDSADRVYCLSLQLFALDQLKRQKESKDV